MLFSDYEGRIFNTQPFYNTLSQITYEALEDNDISEEQYHKIIEMCVLKMIGRYKDGGERYDKKSTKSSIKSVIKS